jgi:hypothetical protein
MSAAITASGTATYKTRPKSQTVLSLEVQVGFLFSKVQRCKSMTLKADGVMLMWSLLH